MSENNIQDAELVYVILGAILKKIGPVTLNENDFHFTEQESDVLVAYNDNDSMTVALGTQTGSGFYEES